MRPKTAYPNNCTWSNNSDFLPSEAEKSRKAVSPGPGKYETIDVIGKNSNTKSISNHVQPFAHGKRFHNEKSTPGPMDYMNKTI